MLMETAMVILTETATGMVKARLRVRAMVKVKDRRRVLQFAVQADSGASAWSKEHWAARLVAEVDHSLLH
jgi:hypothetical protein